MPAIGILNGGTLSEDLYRTLQTRKSLLLAYYARNIKHLRAFTLAHQCQTEGIHYLAKRVALSLYPLFHTSLLILDGKIVERPEQSSKFAHLDSRILFPTLSYSLFVLCLRSNEIESGSIPKFMDKIHTSLHQRHNFCKRRHIHLHSMRFYHWSKERGYLFIIFFNYIFVVKPYHLLIVETCAGLAAMRKVELFHKFVEAHHFNIITGVPP